MSVASVGEPAVVAFFPGWGEKKILAQVPQACVMGLALATGRGPTAAAPSPDAMRLTT